MKSIFEMKSIFVIGACCVVGLLIQPFGSPPHQPSNPTTTTTVVCGNPIGLNVNIANQPIAAKKYAVPFIAGASGDAINVIWWARWTAADSGYSKGTGGNIEVSVFDDLNGAPHVQVGLAETEIFDLKNNPPTPVSSFQTTNFNSAVSLTEGEKYWIVFENTHDDYANNFISLNGPLLRNHDFRFGGPFGSSSLPKDARAFDWARPCGDLFLHESPKNDDAGVWRLYQESKLPRQVPFPYVFLRIDDGTGVTKGNGFPFAYGPLHSTYDSVPEHQYEYEYMYHVGGENRIMQIANFNDKDTFPLSNTTLNVFAGVKSSLVNQVIPTQDEEESLAVFVNGVFQGCVWIGKLDWYSIDLDIPIEANEDYEIEFVATNSAKIVIMHAPVYHGGDSGLGYVGKAQHSTDSGATWRGFNVGHHVNQQRNQLCFYIEGEGELP